jgi:N-acetyl-gamma-glutamylphosphate reductase
VSLDLTTLYRTGVTGYIGGEGLYTIATAHPDWQLSALVRSKEKATQVTSKYPEIRIVHGDLDSVDIIAEEVKNADIVYSQYLTEPTIDLSIFTELTSV